MTEIVNEPSYRKGQTFHALSSGDKLVRYPGLPLLSLVQLAKQTGETVFWCCHYEGYTALEKVYIGDNDDCMVRESPARRA